VTCKIDGTVNKKIKNLKKKQKIKKFNSLPAAEIDFTSLVSFSTSLQDINLRTFTRF